MRLAIETVPHSTPLEVSTITLSLTFGVVSASDNFANETIGVSLETQVNDVQLEVNNEKVSKMDSDTLLKSTNEDVSEMDSDTLLESANEDNVLEKNEGFRERYLCSLADYADRCVDDIRKIVEELKEGKIDNSTAKLLIETMKWLVQKISNDVNGVQEAVGDSDVDCVREIMVKFV